MAEMKSPDFATIQAAVAGEQWALDKVLECYGDEDMRQQLIKKLLEAIPQFLIEEA